MQDIGVRLDQLAPQLQSLDDNDPAAREVRKLVGEHLPELINGYKRIPESLKRKEHGGKTPEQPADFNVRVSERLRHKRRALTIWDYERLVLEKFPQIYKVKCLNHTQYEPAPGPGGIYRELAPGHVTIVTVPTPTEHGNCNCVCIRVRISVAICCCRGSTRSSVNTRN